MVEITRTIFKASHTHTCRSFGKDYSECYSTIKAPPGLHREVNTRVWRQSLLMPTVLGPGQMVAAVNRFQHFPCRAATGLTLVRTVIRKRSFLALQQARMAASSQPHTDRALIACCKS